MPYIDRGPYPRSPAARMLRDMTRTAFDTTARLTLTLSAALLLAACVGEPATDDGAAASEDTGPEPSSSSDDASDAPETTTADASSSSSSSSSSGADSGSDDEPTTGEPSTDDGQTTGEPVEGRSFVLVHGAWMGAWSWERVTPLLEQAGHEVRVVELPAHGDDLAEPAGTTLDGYRDTVLAAMADAGEPVVLVAHSMGGMVISAAGQAEPQNVEALVYVAGYLPVDGQSLLDLAFMDAGSILGAHLIDHGDGTASIDNDFIGDVFCADCTDEDVTLLQDRHRPEGFAPLATPITLTDDAFGSLPRFYVHTAQDVAVSPLLQDQMVAASPVDGEVTLDTAHSPMLTNPEGLAEEIMAFVP
jgi:pimeloyl-ACP methyl ester carboxylesterase